MCCRHAFVEACAYPYKHYERAARSAVQCRSPGELREAKEALDLQKKAAAQALELQQREASGRMASPLSSSKLV